MRIESTSIRMKDAEQCRETEDRLSWNKAGLSTKYFNIPAGRDNRCSELHPACYLPGAACLAARQFITARDVIGMTNPPQLSCYDMNSVGMGRFVKPWGWLELGTNGSSKLRIGMFNINNTARSGKATDEDGTQEMKTVEDFILAPRTLRAAVQFVCSWNYSFLALENYFYNKSFMKEDLKYDENPANTLCQFTDFIISENSSRWRDGSAFICFGELQGYWDAFVGARPQSKPHHAAHGSNREKNPAGQFKKQERKRKYP